MGQPIPHLEAWEFVLYDAIMEEDMEEEGRRKGRNRGGGRRRKERRREERDFIRGSNPRDGADAIKSRQFSYQFASPWCYDFHAHSNTVTTPNVTSIENQPRYVRSFPVIYYRCHTSVILLHRPLIARTALCLVHTDRFKGIEQLRKRERERMEKRGFSYIILSIKLLLKKEKDLRWSWLRLKFEGFLFGE